MKIIFYSVFILAARVFKKWMKYTKLSDPLNQTGFQDILVLFYYVSLLAPLLMVWDVFETLSAMKVGLLIY